MIFVCQDRDLPLPRLTMVQAAAIAACGPKYSDAELEGLALWLVLGYSPIGEWPDVWTNPELLHVLRGLYDEECSKKGGLYLPELRREWAAFMKGTR